MDSCFNLTLPKSSFCSGYAKCYDATFQKNKAAFDAKLSIYHRMDKETLDGKTIIDEWFPELQFDMFISHSHQDENLAKDFAGWLLCEMGITAFIDSQVWGYSDKLLHLIDDNFCQTDDRKHYDYLSRNGSTAHVHMMLITSLFNMILKSKSLFFLNTDASMTVSRTIANTYSAWIYAEIEFADALVKKKEQRTFSALNESLKIKYPLKLQNFKKVDEDTLETWKAICDEDQNKGVNNKLDILSRYTHV